MKNNTSLIFGSTGFTGSLALSHLKGFEGPIIAINRRKIEDFDDRIEQVILRDFNFDDLNLPKIDHAYICLGTKLRAWELLVMSKEKKIFL